jgi:hypothetical protein
MTAEHTPPPMNDALTAQLRRLSSTSTGPHVDDAELVALRAGRLDTTRATQVEGHLATCAECRSLWADLADSPAPAAIEAALESAPRKVQRRWMPVVGVLAAAGLVLSFGVSQMPTGSGPEAGVTIPDWQWYRPIRPMGGVADNRGADAGASATPVKPVVFLTYSNVQIRVEPEPGAEERKVPLAVAAFVAEPGAVLRSAPSGSVQILDGGAVQLLARGDALLGTKPGPRVVYLTLGMQAPSVDGRPVSELLSQAASMGVRVFEFPVQLMAEPGTE